MHLRGHRCCTFQLLAWQNNKGWSACSCTTQFRPWNLISTYGDLRFGPWTDGVLHHSASFKSSFWNCTSRQRFGTLACAVGRVLAKAGMHEFNWDRGGPGGRVSAWSLANFVCVILTLFSSHRCFHGWANEINGVKDNNKMAWWFTLTSVCPTELLSVLTPILLCSQTQHLFFFLYCGRIFNGGLNPNLRLLNMRIRTDSEIGQGILWTLCANKVCRLKTVCVSLSKQQFEVIGAPPWLWNSTYLQSWHKWAITKEKLLK